MRAASAAGLAILTCLVAFATPPAHQPARNQLPGAWRLVRIDYIGPAGPVRDPFYQPDSEGLLIYDPSGWMSVEIGARHRESVPVSESRVEPPPAAQTRERAAAFDTYYAYFGTWVYDPTRGVITHHVESSLIPSENGADYSQDVVLDADRLTFVNRVPAHDDPDGSRVVRRKVWERLRPAGDGGKR